MTVRSSLRDRRRLETGRDIQSAALALALEHGYDHVTTEMIAQQSGISVRTFFNYFANKDAAIVGSPPCISDAAYERFRSSRGPVVSDLMDALAVMLPRSNDDRERIRMIDLLLTRTPELEPLFVTSMQILGRQLSEMALERLGEEYQPLAALLGDTIIHALAIGFREWASDPGVDDDQIVSIARDQLASLGLMLAEARR